jgi:hypothetical protein
MDIESKLTKSVPVTDIDIAYSSGALSSHTLYNGKDRWERKGAVLSLIFASGEVIEINWSHVAWWSVRARLIEVPIKKPTDDPTDPGSSRPRPS